VVVQEKAKKISRHQYVNLSNKILFVIDQTMANLKKFLAVHIVKALQGFEAELSKPTRSTPLDIYVKNFMKENKKLGSSDRAVITDYIYAAIRHKVLLDVIAQKPVTWESRIAALYSDIFFNQQKNPSFLL